MKHSEINRAWRDASECFRRHHWALPPEPHWDITDFGLGNFRRHGLTLINLASEPEYCEKLMYATVGQTTPCHTHARKKEDIICRVGELIVRVWSERPADVTTAGPFFFVPLNGARISIQAGKDFLLPAGSRITLTAGVWHEFRPATAECIIGEVSTANDDVHDNFFLDPEVGRFPEFEADEPLQVSLPGR